MHLAAQADVRVSVAEPAFDAAVNVLGTVNVLEAARHVGARVVFASTGGAIYGECDATGARGRPVPAALSRTAPRSSPARATSARSRASTARRTSRSASATSTGRARTRTARPAWWRSSSGGCATASRARIFGDGSQSRDYVYVGDVARATLAALDSELGGVLNVGTGVATSVLELYDVCRSAAGSDAAPVHEAERPGELGRSVLDGELAADDARLPARDVARRRASPRPGTMRSEREVAKKEQGAGGRTSRRGRDRSSTTTG